MTTLYGIPNCDTIKKAKKWLEANKLEYQFHDYRKDGLDENWLIKTESVLGWETMLNKRGTTYRQLSDEQKNTINKESALALMLKFPAMIKRPILIHSDSYHIGFNAESYSQVFA
ncbi:ArsC family reductase [Glaciecola sp. MF2-115]|uniref:ArsC family reductase n=1 Tax=Glaciecola sp. MF2-115 TaxID=3384827 RepID=UPI00399F4211